MRIAIVRKLLSSIKDIFLQYFRWDLSTIQIDIQKCHHTTNLSIIELIAEITDNIRLWLLTLWNNNLKISTNLQMASFLINLSVVCLLITIICSIFISYALSSDATKLCLTLWLYWERCCIVIVITFSEHIIFIIDFVV